MSWKPRREIKTEVIEKDCKGYYDGMLGPDYRGAIWWDTRESGNPYVVAFDALADRTPRTIMHNPIPLPARRENTHLGPHFTHESWYPPKIENGDIQHYRKVPPEVKTKERLRQERKSWWRHGVEVSTMELEAVP